jgi:integrase
LLSSKNVPIGDARTHGAVASVDLAAVAPVDMRSTRIHALRHYSATELLAAGVDLRTVAGRLGHGSGGVTTLRTYAAWVEQADRRAAETIAQIIPKPAPTPRVRGPYETIAADLREKIMTGELKPGDQLPTIVQLAAQHTVAAGTATARWRCFRPRA